MKLKGTFFILILFFFSILRAQNVGVYHSWEDYFSGKMEETDLITITPMKEYSIKATTKDKALKKGLKKTIPALLINDRLYVNTRLMQKDSQKLGNLFVEAEDRNGKLFFKAFSGRANQVHYTVALGILGGAIGGAMSGAISGALTGYEYFVYIPTSGKCLQIDRDLMKILLQPFPKLSAAYALEEKPKKKDIIWKYMELYLEQPEKTFIEE